VKALAIKDLHSSWYLKILSNCTCLKALWENVTDGVNSWLHSIPFMWSIAYNTYFSVIFVCLAIQSSFNSQQKFTVVPKQY